MKSRMIVTFLLIIFALFSFSTGAYSQSGVESMPLVEGDLMPLSEFPDQDALDSIFQNSGVSVKSSGSWSDIQVGPDIYHEGILAYCSFSHSVSVPSDTYVTYVRWGPKLPDRFIHNKLINR
jgi:hypothetical protein